MKHENLKDYLQHKIVGLRTQADSIAEMIRRFDEEGFDWDEVDEGQERSILSMFGLENEDYERITG